MTAAADEAPHYARTGRAGTVDVLVVEDDAAMRELLEQLLLGEGYSVTTAQNGAEALAHMRETPVRLVLLDLLLPGVNGYEFRAAQLQDDRLAKVPVVITSGEGNLHIAAARMRVRDFLAKPFDYGKLLAVVRRYLR